MKNIPSYEEILNQCLSAIPNDIYKEEGTLIYDAIAPAALQLAQAYLTLQEYFNAGMLDTSFGTYLDRLSNQYGIYRLKAVHAVRKITVVSAEATIPLGTRLGIDGIVYSVTKKITVHEYEVTCSQGGKIGNSITGEMTLIDQVDGIGKITIGEIIILGEDEEADENFRTRIKDTLSKNAADGNVNQYYKWSSEFNGIGRSKVFPLWAGGNTVKISITNTNNQVASPELVSKFQDYLDPGTKGLGNGKAPIGSKVTVTNGTMKNIDIYVEVKLATGYVSPEGVTDTIVKFLSDVTYVKDVISYMHLGSALLNTNSVADVRNMTICGVAGDVTLSDDEVPTLNNLNVVVI